MRVGGADGVPGDGVGMLADLAEKQPAVGHRHQLGGPVAHREDRVGPFQQDRP